MAANFIVLKMLSFRRLIARSHLKLNLLGSLKQHITMFAQPRCGWESSRDHHEQSPIKICQLVFKVSGYACTRYNFHEYEFLDKDIIGESKIFVGCSI